MAGDPTLEKTMTLSAESERDMPAQIFQYGKQTYERKQLLNPIPTYWKGRYFRSRLEARWAVFFDSLGIAYEYEKEAYPVGNGIHYLPDFWLIDLKFWVEIKPARPTPEEFEKAHRLVNSCGISLYMAIEPIGFVPPWAPADMPYPLMYDHGDGPPMHLAFLEEDHQDENYQWTCCPSCGRYGIEYQGRCQRLCLCEAGSGKEGRSESRCDSLLLAYECALMERFDRPWKPPVKKQLRSTGSLG